MHSFYKASEYLNWGLYYSLIVVQQFLPRDYFENWKLFVISLFNLLKKPIFVHPDLDETEILLRLFVRDLDKLYGDRVYTYNVHQLTHIVLCVKRWGPLSATSAFPYENYNNVLGSLVHGSKHLGQEMANNIMLAEGLAALRSQNSRQNQTMISFPSRFTYEKLRNPKTLDDLYDEEIDLIKKRIGLQSKDIKCFFRTKINSNVYTSFFYKTTKTNSFTVKVNLKDDSVIYGEIRFFFEHNDDLYFILNFFIVEHTKMFVHLETKSYVKHIVPIEKGHGFILLNRRDIKSICHVIRAGNYICKQPIVVDNLFNGF